MQAVHPVPAPASPLPIRASLLSWPGSLSFGPWPQCDRDADAEALGPTLYERGIRWLIIW